jgi:hypothetical protein
MNEDFSLGDLGDRITELEEETAQETQEPAQEKESVSDFKSMPPFAELQYLNLAHNQVWKNKKCCNFFFL